MNATCTFDPGRLVPRLDMTFAAEVRSIDPAVGRIMEVVRSMQCAEGKEFEIETALREALANAVIHGAGDDPGKKVEVSVACEEDRGMLIVVRDPGPGFDPATLPSPLVGRNIFSTHGRGIYLINTLMDEVRFERGGTEIHMRKR